MDRTSATYNTDIGGGRRGYRDRNLGAGLRGTALIALDRNAIQEELMAIQEAAGIVADPDNWGQVLQALGILFGGGGSLGPTGWQRLPGNLIMQWGSFSGTTGALSGDGVAEITSIFVSWPIAFPTAFYRVFTSVLDVVGSNLQEQVVVGGATSTTQGDFGLICRAASQPMSANYLALGR